MGKILVVDDDNVMRVGITAMLKNANQDVIEASDGEAALRVALTEKPDLIVTDIRMPHMSGLEMLEKLREDNWGAKVPVIILTGDDSNETINKALESGITSYFEKSSDPQVLMQQILAQV
jgi:CheY-like chemotaxis protein